MGKALVILSGGQDSTYCLGAAVALHGGSDKVIALTFDYGQSHARELQAAATIANLFGVEHRVVSVPGILLSTSPLLDKERPLAQYDSAEAMGAAVGDTVEDTFVPMRNAFFLTLGANHALAWGCNYLYTGVCQNDDANYPDCTEAFIQAQQRAIDAALGVLGLVKIMTPLLHVSKAAQCRAGLEVPGVYHAWAYSHTAYDGEYPPLGKDHASVLRAASFEAAGVPDPLVARAVFEGVMDIPDTDNYDVLDEERTPYERPPETVVELCRALGAV